MKDTISKKELRKHLGASFLEDLEALGIKAPSKTSVNVFADGVRLISNKSCLIAIDRQLYPFDKHEDIQSITFGVAANGADRELLVGVNQRLNEVMSIAKAYIYAFNCIVSKTTNPFF